MKLLSSNGTSLLFSASQPWLGRNRSILSAGTWKKVSCMSSGSNRRSCRNSPNGCPLMRSMTAPVTSTATL